MIYAKLSTILVILLPLLLFCAFATKIFIIKENFQNKQIEGFSSQNDISYVYWTGGFDSTYRLCEMLVVEKKTVQPIYVSLVLDNDCQSEESCNKLWLRRNRKEERKAMKTIRERLAIKFPYTKTTMLPTLEVDEPIHNQIFNYQFEKNFYSDNLWPKKRRKHQYLFLSKYATYHKKYIDIGVLGIHEGSKFAVFLKNSLRREDNNYVITDNNHPLHYLRFPLYGKSKERLLTDSQIYGFADILQETWSCWFPKNGKACNKCPMCRERIVSHPN